MTIFSKATPSPTVSPIVVDSIAALHALADGPTIESEWLTIDQSMIDAFAEITGDRQWIHVDPVRAAESPFKSTIAHGLLTLSLVPGLFTKAFEFPNRKVSLNYGFQKIRFPSPVPVGSRVRVEFSLAQVDDVGPGVGRCQFDVRMDISGKDKPALVATWLIQMGY